MGKVAWICRLQLVLLGCRADIAKVPVQRSVLENEWAMTTMLQMTAVHFGLVVVWPLAQYYMSMLHNAQCYQTSIFCC